ncbi:UNVERIFIED_CONTAM: Scavenger receptor class F member 2 [Gekko kuhli]
MTCPPGQYGENCAESCSCHKDSCDPVTGDCYMEANQRMGVIGAGALLTLLLILLLSLLCCCCVCRKKDQPRDTNQDPVNKKSPRRLCGRFSQISMKLPRIPLRRQKLPKVVAYG